MCCVVLCCVRYEVRLFGKNVGERVWERTEESEETSAPHICRSSFTTHHKKQKTDDRKGEMSASSRLMENTRSRARADLALKIKMPGLEKKLWKRLWNKFCVFCRAKVGREGEGSGNK